MFFQELTTKNDLLYKQASFDLRYRGLSVVYGDNRDAGRKSTNAAGKSYLFGKLPELLGISPPLTSKGDKLKKGVTALRFIKNKKPYKVIQKKNKIILNEGKEDKKIHKKRYALEKLQNIHGWTEDEFYSIVYIDSRRPNLLHMGSTKQRRDFIISMFRLSNVDNLRKYFNAELRRIAEDKSAYQEIKRQYKSLAEQLIDESELGLQEKIDRLEKIYKKLAARVEKASALAELLQFRRENKKSIKKLLRRLNITVDEFLVLKDPEEAVDTAIEKYREDNLNREKQLEHAIAWTKYQDRVANYQEQSIPLLKRLAKYEDLSPEAIEIGVKKYRTAQARLESVQSDIIEQRKNLPEKVEDTDNEPLHDEARDKCRTRLRNYVELLEQSEKFADGKCPLCKSPVKIHNPKIIKKKIRALRQKLDRDDKARGTAEIRRQRKVAIIGLRDLKKRKSKLSRMVEKYKRYFQANEIYEKIPEAPKPYEGKKFDEKVVRQILAENTQRTTFLTAVRPLINKIKQALSLSEEDKQETYYLPDLRKRLDSVVARLPTIKSSYEKMITVKRSMAELKIRAKELFQSVKDEQAFELLVEAYGNAGIKKLMLQRIGTHLEQCLNRYSRFVFSERYEFKVNIDTQFDIIVKRRLADRVVVSDVRRLSGAESKAFILLLYLSLLSLIPANRRSNILVLDEPDANLGPEMRENLKRFIPILNKIVPHIIIITPHTDMRYEGARVFTVVKERGYSRLVESK